MLNRSGALACLVALVLIASAALAPHEARANKSNITGVKLDTLFTAQSIAPSGNATTSDPGKIGSSENQSVQFRGVGTSPNFKIEVLITLDGTNYQKPETGGDIGTFTDQNYHVAAVTVPLCVGWKFKATELGGANAVAIDLVSASQ